MKKQLLLPFREPKLVALWEQFPQASREGLIALYAQLIEKILQVKPTEPPEEPIHDAV